MKIHWANGNQLTVNTTLNGIVVLARVHIGNTKRGLGPKARLWLNRVVLISVVMPDRSIRTIFDENTGPVFKTRTAARAFAEKMITEGLLNN